MVANSVRGSKSIPQCTMLMLGAAAFCKNLDHIFKGNAGDYCKEALGCKGKLVLMGHSCQVTGKAATSCPTSVIVVNAVPACLVACVQL